MSGSAFLNLEQTLRLFSRLHTDRVEIFSRGPGYGPAIHVKWTPGAYSEFPGEKQKSTYGFDIHGEPTGYADWTKTAAGAWVQVSGS